MLALVHGGDDVDIEIRSTVHGPIVPGLTDAFTAIADEPVTGETDAVTAADDAESDVRSDARRNLAAMQMPDLAQGQDDADLPTLLGP
mgnify:CR=1 FL=1